MKDTIKVLLTIEIDSETNESKVIGRELINEEKVVKKRTTTKTVNKKDTDPVAKLILEDNKYRFNSAAVTLMGIEPENRIDIKYEKNGAVMVPIVGTNEVFGTMGGNRLTKSYTVSYKGKNRDRLLEYGDVFEITPHKTKEGIFVLTGNKEQPSTVIVDEFNTEDSSTEQDINVDIDFSELDSNDVKEINSFDFKL